MKCPHCQGEVQAHWVACPRCGSALPAPRCCPHCAADVQPGWKACPACGSPLPNPSEDEAPSAARMDLDDAVAKEAAQRADGPGGASLSARDSVVGRVGQDVSGGGSPEAGQAKVRSLARMDLTDVVAKSVTQNVQVNLVGAEAVETLLGLGAARRLRTSRVFVACGRQVLAYNPHSEHRRDEPVAEYTFPGEMGSARSVRLAKQGERLLVLAGAHRGVVAFDSHSGAARVYPFPQETDFGVNAATIHGEFLYATHSELGLLRWPVRGGEPTALFPGLFGPAATARTVRGIQASLAGHLVLCAGPSVYRIDAGKDGAEPVRYEAGAATSLVGVAECGELLLAACNDGRIFRWRVGEPGPPERQLTPPGERTYSLSLAQMPEGPHLVLGARRPALRTLKLVPPEAVVDYRTPDGEPIRWARAAADLAVACDHACRRLHVWTRGQVYRPVFSVRVPLRPGARVMDLCFLSQ